MNPVILFRPDIHVESEFNCVKDFFDVYVTRAKIPKDKLIFPRYSALPFYKELEEDVLTLGSSLINSNSQFQWIANFEYYDVLKDYTFKTYFDPQYLPDDKSFVVKGKTNSRKHQWDTHCFAKDKRSAVEIYCDLKNDGLIGYQDIIFREYEPLVTFDTLVSGLPVTNEFRFFFYKNIELCHGYYWSNAEYPEKGKLDDRALKMVKDVANIVCDYNNFFVIDIAQKVNGEWIVVELNAGEMSGLSLCNPIELYGNLKKNIG